MVRGYQKRIIHLKNTNSDAFEEAFFLVSECGTGMCERELIEEANRIIDRSVTKDKDNKKGEKIKRAVFPFALGCLITSLIWIFITIV